MNIWKKKDFKNFVRAFVITVAACFIFTAVCCCGFRPYENNKASSEYNMAINAMKLADRTKNILIAEQPIKNFYSSLHRDNCRREIFGIDEKGNINAVDYDDAKKYRNYNECLKELK